MQFLHFVAFFSHGKGNGRLQFESCTLYLVMM
jgi:hypothetical protein